MAPTNFLVVVITGALVVCAEPALAGRATFKSRLTVTPAKGKPKTIDILHEPAGEDFTGERHWRPSFRPAGPRNWFSRYTRRLFIDGASLQMRVHHRRITLAEPDGDHGFKDTNASVLFTEAGYGTVAHALEIRRRARSIDAALTYAWSIGLLAQYQLEGLAFVVGDLDEDYEPPANSEVGWIARQARIIIENGGIYRVATLLGPDQSVEAEVNDRLTLTLRTY
jgi:hypothetical protein